MYKVACLFPSAGRKNNKNKKIMSVETRLNNASLSICLPKTLMLMSISSQCVGRAQAPAAPIEAASTPPCPCLPQRPSPHPRPLPPPTPKMCAQALGFN